MARYAISNPEGSDQTPAPIDTEPIENLIAERGARYGSLNGVGYRYSQLKNMLSQDGVIPDAEKYCRDMLLVKIARWLGNPTDKDTILDIQGYCHLLLHGD